MSLESFWPQSFDSMGKPRKPKDKNDAPSGNNDSHQDGEGPPSPDANEATVDLDPAMAKAFEVMTANITKVIDDKLGPIV